MLVSVRVRRHQRRCGCTPASLHHTRRRASRTWRSRSQGPRGVPRKASSNASNNVDRAQPARPERCGKFFDRHPSHYPRSTFPTPSPTIRAPEGIELPRGSVDELAHAGLDWLPAGGPFSTRSGQSWRVPTGVASAPVGYCARTRRRSVAHQGGPLKHYAASHEYLDSAVSIGPERTRCRAVGDHCASGD